MSGPNLYKSIHIPIPRKPFEVSDSDTADQICTKLDGLFNDITEGYPSETRSLVRAMYYENEGVFPITDLINEQAAFATWQVFQDEEEPQGVHVVFIDQAIAPCKIVEKFCKMHEVAGHAGQAHQRISQIGINDFLKECASGVFNKFTDQSVSLAEKVILNALSMTMIDRDLAEATDKRAATAFFNQFYDMKRYNYEDYTLLLHRSRFCPIAADLSVQDYNRFHARDDVKKFDKLMRDDTPAETLEVRGMVRRNFVGQKLD